MVRALIQRLRPIVFARAGRLMKRESRKEASLKEAAFRALHTRSGGVITGCNMENSAYGLAICAETLAVASAVSQGLTDFDEIAIASDDNEPTPPCGACRQVLNEFAPNIKISSYTRDGKEAVWTLDQLLPHAFVLNPSRGRA